MKYKVLDSFKARTDKGEVELLPGQLIILSRDKALKLLNDGKIVPGEGAAYKVYSEILEAYLWVVETDEDMHSLRGQETQEPIYTIKECSKLKSIDRAALKDIHEVKKVFEKSKLEDVKRGKNADNR